MKYIYLVETRELKNDKFELYRTEAFSSKKKAVADMENIITCNKGYDIKVDDSDDVLPMLDYTTLGWGRDDARVEMRLRMIITKKELK